VNSPQESDEVKQARRDFLWLIRVCHGSDSARAENGDQVLPTPSPDTSTKDKA